MGSALRLFFTRKVTRSYHRALSARGYSTRQLSVLIFSLLFFGATLWPQETLAQDTPLFEPGNPEVQEEQPTASSPDTDIPTVSGRTEPPPGYQQIEVLDRTIGFRDDSFLGISQGKDGVIWVSTYQGRVYRSDDEGDNWDEHTVLPEMKEIWGFASQYVLLGSIRSDNAIGNQSVKLSPGGGIGSQGRDYQLLSGQVLGAGRHDSGTSAGGNALAGTPSYRQSGGFSNPLGAFAERAAGSQSGVLGAGLSQRAPRLSLLLDILKRPVANISMQRLLYKTAGRYTSIRDVTPHASDPNILFAPTGFGLYQSRDGGKSWFRAFPGMTPAERWIGHVATDPMRPKRVYMGTSSGLYMSIDGGDSWTKNTKIPEIPITRIAIDPTDSRYVYIAGWGGVYRSDDYGENFQFAFYHSIPNRRRVQWITIDPFDPNVAYLGTLDGMMRTTKLRTARISDWKVVSGLRTVNLGIQSVLMCTKHRGHMYMLTRADLPKINYEANGPESLIAESWDHGRSWRELVGNQTGGDIQWFTLDSQDPDQLWVAFSRAVVQIKRKPQITFTKNNVEKGLEKPLRMGKPVLPDLPSMSAVIQAALLYNELELEEFVDRLDRLRTRNWLPNRFHIAGDYNIWNVGGTLQDIKFTGDRLAQRQKHTSWAVTAWLSWSLPDLIFRQDSAPLMGIRQLKMINSVRERMLHTIHRNYGELQRVEVTERYGEKQSLNTRINLALRIEYLEALVNLATGGFLDKWTKK